MEVIRTDKLNVNGGFIEIRATLDDFEGDQFITLKLMELNGLLQKAKCIVLFFMK